MSDLETRIAGLPAITLTELVEQAALLQRTDRKYVVTEQQLTTWLDLLGADVRVLEIDGRRALRYASLYFDTPERDSFRASAHKRRRRFKVRVRSYLDTGGDFIEVKVRDARRRTLKTRMPCGSSVLTGLDDASRQFVREQLEANGLRGQLAEALVPMLETHFTRTTFHIPSSGARVTVDRTLDVREPGTEGLLLPGLIVMETKSDSGDLRADRILWSLGVRPRKVSKFAIGSALLDPSLPDNKWRNTMNRCLPTSEPRGAAAVPTAH